MATFSPLPSPELINQLRQLQQIRYAEERTGFTDDYFRIRGNEIGPLRRNSADARIIDLQQEALPIMVASFTHAGELLPAERMERVRDPHKTRRWDRSTCILD